MTATDLIDRLAGHKTLGAAPREELAWLASHGTLRQIAEGEVVNRVASAGGEGAMVVRFVHEYLDLT